jgi:hypothetical protein
MKVICNKLKCKRRSECGGAKLHEPCSECDHCPVDKTAKCEVTEVNLNDLDNLYCR